jgi:hypothetical protein
MSVQGENLQTDADVWINLGGLPGHSFSNKHCDAMCT